MDHPVIPELLEQVNEASTGLAKFSWTIPQAGQLWCSPHSMEPAECHHIYKHVLDKKGQKIQKAAAILPPGLPYPE